MGRECECVLRQEDYDQYFRSQSQHGGSMNAFSGATRQKGYGIGSLISKGISMATPLLKEGAKHIGKSLLSKGTDLVGNLAEDYLSGKNMQASLKGQLKDAKTGLVRDAVTYFAPKANKTSVQKRKRSTSSKTTKRKRPKKSGEGDIFD